MDIYTAWKFTKDPFETSALPSDDVGNDLIVGREVDIERFLKRLYNGNRIVTLEGDVGIGKTSIINVGVYRASLRYFTNKNTIDPDTPNPLFFACIHNFQIDEEFNSEKFREKVFRSIAQTIIQYKDTFRHLRIQLSHIEEVNHWLHNPEYSSVGGSIGAIGFQVGGTKTTQLNETVGFEQNGIEHIVKKWLNKIFHDSIGGVVCVIDNLELLRSSAEARRIIESLRDTLFTINGIRWVFCGSFGIVSSILSSPRIEGFLHDPIIIKGISPNYIKLLFDKRVKKYKKNESSYLPITSNSFAILHEILNQNIRSTLRYAGEYCFWVSDNYKHPITDEEKDSLFLNWLIQKSSIYLKDIENSTNQKINQLFTKLIQYDKKDELVSFSDYSKYGFKNSNAFKSAIKELERVGIVTTVIDENDNRRKSVMVLPKGYFISYAIEQREIK